MEKRDRPVGACPEEDAQKAGTPLLGSRPERTSVVQPGGKKSRGSLTVPKGGVKERWKQHSPGPVATEQGVKV